jgi:ABC-type Fe3+/spermidine/putrescine transport system ATPase subunit
MEIEKSGLYFKNLTKKFGTIVAVDDICLHVEEGEFLTLLGPSGSGKTTTLMMVAGFRTAHIRQDFHQGRGRHDRPAFRKKYRHGVPELCALPPHDGF